MTAEINLAGVFVPTFAVSFIVAMGLSVLLSKALVRFTTNGFHRFIWHPALFDVAIFVILLGAMINLLDLLLS
jgi:hypothetical protein